MRPVARLERRLPLVLGFAFVLIATASAAALDPSTRLLDSGKPLATTLPADWSGATPPPGWSIVPEDKLDHKFKGNPVICNDKLVLLIDKLGTIRLYSLIPTGWTFRSHIGVYANQIDPKKELIGVKIVENNAGAVAIELAHKTKAGKTAVVELRLTAGVSFAQVKPGAGAAAIGIIDAPYYLVVPDYFADDAVLRSMSTMKESVNLPAENCVLCLLDKGQAMLACLWQSNQASVVVMNDSGEPEEEHVRLLHGVRIEAFKDKSLWIAVLENRPAKAGPAGALPSTIWHEQEIAATTEPTALAWKPPFPAKWRGDVVRSGLLAESCDFLDAPPAKPTTQKSECWFDGDRAMCRLKAGLKGDANLIVYPMDRSRTTPLAAFCLLDMMRATLGVGPCQYILDIEGMSSETPPTPEAVSQWVLEQFRKKKDQGQAGSIRERLGLMTDHVKQMQARLGKYRELAEKLRAACQAEAKNLDTPSAADMVAILDELLARPDEDLAPAAQKAVNAMIALIGKDGALPTCQELSGQLCSIGQAQDRGLARYRMALRRLRLESRSLPPGEFATSIQTQVEAMLGKKER